MRLPKEHGAWAMLYVPFALGAVTAVWHGGFHVVHTILLLVAVSAAFVGRESVVAWWRARRLGHPTAAAARDAVGLSLLAGATALPLFQRTRAFVFLFLVGAVLYAIHLQQVRRQEVRTFLGEVLGIAALALAAPAAYVAGRGAWHPTGAWLWGLCVVYFTSSVFYVKLRVADLQVRRRAEQRRLRIGAMLYHSGLLAVLAVLAASGRLPSVTLLAFAPVVVRAGWAVWRGARKLDLRRTGILEIVYALNFLVWIAAGLRRD